MTGTYNEFHPDDYRHENNMPNNDNRSIKNMGTRDITGTYVTIIMVTEDQSD